MKTNDKEGRKEGSIKELPPSLPSSSGRDGQERARDARLAALLQRMDDLESTVLHRIEDLARDLRALAVRGAAASPALPSVPEGAPVRWEPDTPERAECLRRALAIVATDPTCRGPKAQEEAARWLRGRSYETVAKSVANVFLFAASGKRFDKAPLGLFKHSLGKASTHPLEEGVSANLAAVDELAAERFGVRSFDEVLKAARPAGPAPRVEVECPAPRPSERDRPPPAHEAVARAQRPGEASFTDQARWRQARAEVFRGLPEAVREAIEAEALAAARAELGAEASEARVRLRASDYQAQHLDRAFGEATRKLAEQRAGGSERVR